MIMAVKRWARAEGEVNEIWTVLYMYHSRVNNKKPVQKQRPLWSKVGHFELAFKTFPDVVMMTGVFRRSREHYSRIRPV